MRRYDWAWERGHARPGWVPYDRIYRSGDAAWEGPWRGQRRRGPPRGGYDRAVGRRSYDRPATGGWPSGYDRGYRYSYPGGGPGGYGGWGRREPWEPGPPGGYGWEWEWAYGGSGGPRGGARGGREPRRHPYDDPYARSPWGYDWSEAVRHAEGWAFPEGYVDEGMEDFFDDEGEEEDGWNGLAGEARQEVPDDEELRERVIRSLHSDGFLDADAIRVEASDGVITLRGEVADYMEARYAWDDAWEVRGVVGVISKLQVRGAPSLTSSGDAGGAVSPSGEDQPRPRRRTKQ